MALAFLAVMLAGAAVVPLGAEDPPARLRCVLEDAGCIAVIAAPARNPAAAARLHEAVHESPRNHVVVVDVACLLSAAGGVVHHVASTFEAGARRRCWDPHPNKLSHVCFTSGSTGRPKGCLGTHGVEERHQPSNLDLPRTIVPVRLLVLHSGNV